MASRGLLRGVLFIFVICLITATADEILPDGVSDLASANTAFALDMYHQLTPAADGGNIFISPFSISSALAMTLAGASDNTLTQMRKVMHFDRVGSSEPESRDLHVAFRNLFQVIETPGNNYTLEIANRLFGREDYQFLQEFLSTTQVYYDAMLEELDFAGAAEESRQYINQWVENRTDEKIQNLIPPGSIDGSTVLVLVNAVYFKGLWKWPFDPDSTSQRPFYTSPTDQVNMDMMSIDRRSLRYTYHEDWESQILELPYEGDKASLVIILPKEKDGSEELDSSMLTAEALETALAGLTEQEIEQTVLPKFKLTQSVSLNKFLSDLGMSDLFDAGLADLSRMNGAKGLYVTAALHKAYVDVNEEGTEAAGSTAIIIGESAPLNPITFVADHPFIFLIRDTQTGSVLFIGRLTQSPGDDENIRGAENPDPSRAACGATAWGILALTLMAMLMAFLR